MRPLPTSVFRSFLNHAWPFLLILPRDAGPGLGPGRGIGPAMRGQAGPEMPGQGDAGGGHPQGPPGRGGGAQGRLRHLRQLLQLYQGAGLRAGHGQYRIHGLRHGEGRHSQVLHHRQTRAGRSGMHQRRSAIAARTRPADLPGQRPGQRRQRDERRRRDLQPQSDQFDEPPGPPERRDSRFHQGVHRDGGMGKDELYRRPARRLRSPGHLPEAQVREIHHLRLRRPPQPAVGP